MNGRRIVKIWGVLGLAVVAAMMGCAPEEAEAPAPSGDEAAETPTAPAPEGLEGSTSEIADKEQAIEVEPAPVEAPGGDIVSLEGLAPEGWTQSGAVEHYGVEDLYVKINGRSELYMGYDVAGLSFVSFTKDDDISRFIDVFVYDMSTPNGAFGMFAVEREPSQPAVDLGREGYRTDANHYFWKGNYYAYLQSSDDDEASAQTALTIATQLAERLGDSGDPVIGLDDLPSSGLVKDTVQYFKTDALSLDFLTEVFTGRYQMDGELVTLFVSRRATEQEASDKVEKYMNYLAEYGEGLDVVKFGGITMAYADLGRGFYDVVFRIGTLFAGVSTVQGRDEAIQAAQNALSMLEGP